VKGSRAKSEGGRAAASGCWEVKRAGAGGKQSSVGVRLSPAGDGAVGVEETCEKKAGATWWMDVLVGGSAQRLFTWERLGDRELLRAWHERAESGAHAAACTQTAPDRQ